MRRFLAFLLVICLIVTPFVLVEAKRKKKESESGADSEDVEEKLDVHKKLVPNAYDDARAEAGVLPKHEIPDPKKNTLMKNMDKRAIAIKAKKLHDQGLEKAMAGQYAEALPGLRAAVRLWPTDTGFLNDLGVTEMRLGQYEKAKWRFLKALEIQPGFDIAADNIKEIKTFMSEVDFQNGQGKYPQKHSLQEPPELEPEYFMNLSIQDDVENPAILGDGPICVRGAGQAWGWDLSKLTPEHIAAKYGKLTADYYPHNMKEETVHPMFFPLKDAVEQLSMPLEGYMNLDTSNQGTYIQWNVDEASWRSLLADMNAELPPVFEDQHWTSKCFSDKDVSTFNKNVHWKMMLIGEKEAGMFNHKDVMRMGSWQVQVTGRKLWHICSPTQDEFVYGAGMVNTFRPDYDRYPKMINASCYQTISNPGDMMYYPRDWWHQTRNLETPSIAFSGSLISRHSQKEFAQKMREQCYGRGNVFHASPEHCARVDQCIRDWHELYEGGEGPLPEMANAPPLNPKGQTATATATTTAKTAKAVHDEM